MTNLAYDEWHDLHEVDAAADAPWHRLVKAHLDEERDLAGKTVLEIGCGRGGFACWLAGHSRPVAKLVAGDFSTTAVSKGRNYAVGQRLHQIAWQVADVQALPHGNGCFDTVISCETVEHVLRPQAAVQELGRVLKSGGRLFLTTPNYLGTMGLYRAYLRLRGRRYTEEGQPINHLTMLPRTLAWVRRAGLHVCAVDAVGHYLPFPGRPPIELPRLNQPRFLMRWLALHSLVVAEKR